jgi:hypothetical protein
LGDIAIDDVDIEAGACANQASCDFETGYCGYYNAQEDDDFDWLRGKGEVYYFTGPKVDHTTNSKEGYYAFANPTRDLKPGNFKSKTKILAKNYLLFKLNTLKRFERPKSLASQRSYKCSERWLSQLVHVSIW